MRFICNFIQVVIAFLAAPLLSNSGQLTISNISAVLRKRIIPVVQSQLEIENPLFAHIKKNVGVVVTNNQIYIAARSGRHSGIYSVAEGTNPPTGKAGYDQPVQAMSYAFGTLELTDQAIEAAQKGEIKAIASALSTEVDALKDDFASDLNRQMQGAGGGILCVTTGTGGDSTSVVVDGHPAGLDDTDYLAEGMVIQFGTGNTGVIDSIDSTTEFTLVSGATWADGVTVTKANDAESQGLASLIDDGDNAAVIHGITRSSNPWANSPTYDTGTTLTEANMIATYIKTRRFGGAKVIFMGDIMYATYAALLISIKRTANTREVLSGGFMGLDFSAGGGNVGVLLDSHTWTGYVQMVDLKALTIAEMSKPFAWLEADAHGGILKRSPDNRTVWEGTLKYYFNLVARKFKSSARMSGQTIP